MFVNLNIKLEAVILLVIDETKTNIASIEVELNLPKAAKQCVSRA